MAEGCLFALGLGHNLQRAGQPLSNQEASIRISVWHLPQILQEPTGGFYPGAPNRPAQVPVLYFTPEVGMTLLDTWSPGPLPKPP